MRGGRGFGLRQFSQKTIVDFLQNTFPAEAAPPGMFLCDYITRFLRRCVSVECNAVLFGKLEAGDILGDHLNYRLEVYP